MKIAIREKAAADLEAVSLISRARTHEPPWPRYGAFAPASSALTRPASPISAVPARCATRELVESPYIVVYQIREERDELVILAIFHGAQNR